MTQLLDVKNLVTRFYTEEGTVHAVNGVSYTLDKGESMAIVGESGSGKSVSVLSKFIGYYQKQTTTLECRLLFSNHIDPVTVWRMET